MANTTVCVSKELHQEFDSDQCHEEAFNELVQVHQVVELCLLKATWVAQRAYLLRWRGTIHHSPSSHLHFSLALSHSSPPPSSYSLPAQVEGHHEGCIRLARSRHWACPTSAGVVAC